MLVAALLALSASFPGTSDDLLLTPNLSEDNVSVIDATTQTEIARIPVGARPERIAMSADGAFAYVGCDVLNASKTVHKVDLATLTVVGVAALPQQSNSNLCELEISPNGAYLVAGDLQGATAHLIETAGMTVLASRQLCLSCDGFSGPLYAGLLMRFTSDSLHVYAGASFDEVFALLSVPAFAIEGQVAGPSSNGSSPYGELEIAGNHDHVPFVNPVNAPTVRMYEAVSGTYIDIKLGAIDANQDIQFATNLGLLAFSDITAGATPSELLVLDLPRRERFSIPGPTTWRNLEYHKALGELWVKSDLGVSVFDLVGRTRGPDITGLSSFAFLEPTFSADGAFYYYPTTGNQVAVIDTATHSIVKSIDVGQNPRGVYRQGDARPTAFRTPAWLGGPLPNALEAPRVRPRRAPRPGQLATKLRIEAPAAGLDFGASIAMDADFDGDGTLDLAIGAPGTDATATGGVRVYSGDSGTLLFEIRGASAGDRFGAFVSTVPDRDGEALRSFALLPGTAKRARLSSRLRVTAGAVEVIEARAAMFQR